MWPGIRPATGWIAYFTSTPAFFRFRPFREARAAPAQPPSTEKMILGFEGSVSYGEQAP